jgi:uncharacterized SAM-binding protein YcdF (DUF218 family)
MKRLWFGLAALMLATVWMARAELLQRAGGGVLEDAAAPVPAELVMVLRGDEVEFARAQEGSRLLHQGFSNRIYVSSALDDRGALRLRGEGIDVASPQRRIVSVLRQAGVACDAILVDLAPPGGGTAGELRRLRRVMQARDLHSVVIATSWYHTHRSRLLAAAILAPTGIAATVVRAGHESDSAQWWRQRYLAVTVLEEFVKLALEGWIGSPAFADDPNPSPPALVSGCGDQHV